MVAWLWLNLLFFTCSTLPLAALFFNAENTDRDVRSLLLGDVQFRLVAAATLLIIAAHCWSSRRWISGLMIWPGRLA